MSKRCSAKNRNRNRCGAWAVTGKDKCALHLDPELAAKIGSRHGRGKHLPSLDPSDFPHRPLKSMGDVGELLEETINRVRQGPFDLRAANAIGFLAGVLLKALDQRIEERLAHLEALMTGNRGTETEVFDFRPAKEPPHEESSATPKGDCVQTSMKGQPELLIERAILQARLEADLLYSLAVNVNVEVIENRQQREREYTFLLGYLSAEMHGNPTKNRVELLRSTVLMFLESVIILDAAITQVAAERLNGQPMLFRDAAVKLGEQLQMAERLSEHFNSLARELGIAEINLEKLRSNLQSEADHQVSMWINLARIAALGTFGTEEKMHAAMDEYYLLFERKSEEVPKDAN